MNQSDDREVHHENANYTKHLIHQFKRMLMVPNVSRAANNIVRREDRHIADDVLIHVRAAENFH